MDWLRVLAFAEATQEGIARVLTVENACLGEKAAQLDVCVARLLPELIYLYGDGAVFEAYESGLAAARQEIKRAMVSLRHVLKGDAERVHVCSLESDAASMAQMAAALGRAYDVLALAQPGGANVHLERLLLKGALMGSGRPCLILPQWAEPRALHGRALIAWKGTPEAARAVRDALPLLRRMQKVRIFEAAEPNVLKGESQDHLARLGDYLKAHGVVVEPPVVTAPTDEVIGAAGQTILDETIAYGADLLVMGGFGHSRLVEIVFGGATQAVIESAPCAVLMSH